MFAGFPADFIFSHPVNLVLLNDFEVFMEKKKAIMMHMEKSMSNPVPFFFLTSLIGCLMAIACSLFSLSLFLFLFFNFRFQFFSRFLVGCSSQSFMLVCWISIFQLL